MSAIIFSIVVVIIWAFIPFTGYLVARALRRRKKINKYSLFALGAVIGLIEFCLFYFDILSNDQNTITTIIVFLLFFMVGFKITDKPKNFKESTDRL